jgi:hypothetical protein
VTDRARLPLVEGGFVSVDFQHRPLARYAWRLDKNGLAYRLGWSVEDGGFFTVRHLHEDVLGVSGKSRLHFLNGDSTDYRVSNLVASREDGTIIRHSRMVPENARPTLALADRGRVRVRPSVRHNP